MPREQPKHGPAVGLRRHRPNPNRAVSCLGRAKFLCLMPGLGQKQTHTYIDTHTYLLFDLFLFRVDIDADCIDIQISSTEEANNAGIVTHWNLERRSFYLTERSVTTGISDQSQRCYDIFCKGTGWTGCSRKPNQKLWRAKLNLQNIMQVLAQLMGWIYQEA